MLIEALSKTLLLFEGYVTMFAIVAKRKKILNHSITHPTSNIFGVSGMKCNLYPYCNNALFDFCRILLLWSKIMKWRVIFVRHISTNCSQKHCPSNSTKLNCGIWMSLSVVQSKICEPDMFVSCIIMIQMALISQ